MAVNSSEMCELHWSKVLWMFEPCLALLKRHKRREERAECGARGKDFYILDLRTTQTRKGNQDVLGAEPPTWWIIRVSHYGQRMKDTENGLYFLNEEISNTLNFNLQYSWPLDTCTRGHGPTTSKSMTRVTDILTTGGKLTATEVDFKLQATGSLISLHGSLAIGQGATHLCQWALLIAKRRRYQSPPPATSAERKMASGAILRVGCSMEWAAAVIVDLKPPAFYLGQIRVTPGPPKLAKWGSVFSVRKFWVLRMSFDRQETLNLSRKTPNRETLGVLNS
ncbi:hypothetical protein B0H13DRAFT_1925446 [Mycena leptocephala]|nr:hypothetical protein B0H13DRAFT_1925446 [Mycena leptocephala]